MSPGVDTHQNKSHADTQECAKSPRNDDTTFAKPHFLSQGSGTGNTHGGMSEAQNQRSSPTTRHARRKSEGTDRSASGNRSATAPWRERLGKGLSSTSLPGHELGPPINLKAPNV